MSAPLQPALPRHSEVFLAGINAQLKQQLDATTSELAYARLKIQVLEEHLRLRGIAKYGPSSEKLSDPQLKLLEEEPGASNQEVQTESERESLPAGGRPKEAAAAGTSRSSDASRRVAARREDCRLRPGAVHCGRCGLETSVISYDRSEVLAVKPAEYYGAPGTSRARSAGAILARARGTSRLTRNLRS